MTSRSDLPWQRSFGFRVGTAFLVMDAAFMLLVFPAYGLLLTGYVAPDRERLGLVVVGLVLGVTVAWLASALALLGPLVRWSTAERQATISPELTARAARRARSIPSVFAALWSLKWIVLFGSLTLLHGAPARHAAVLVFLGALSIGPLPLGYLLALYLVAPLCARIEGCARADGAVSRGTTTTMRWQLGALSLGLCLAPSLYMTSVVFADHLSTATRLWMVVLFFGPVALFAILCAWLFAEILVRPVRLISDTVRAIADQGDVSLVARIPPLRRDELGKLAERINVMIDRLHATELDRQTVTRAVEALNLSLERRVSERTLSLAQTNQALALEMKTRLQLEVELRQSHKLESVGRLASGLAHEINTPLQFASDNVSFVADANASLFALLHSYRAAWAGVAQGEAERTEQLSRAEAQADVDYLTQDVPKAIAQAVEGLQRVGLIVSSMKSFANPDQAEMTPCDLNQSVRVTLLVARHEYAHCADVETDFGELPLVPCHVGSLNQALLHILINAAHAIVDSGRPGRGRIGMQTRVERDRAVISVRDTGSGIARAIADRVFDPFFTTKDVGKGTGQGLAICRAVIVDQHRGELDFETVPGHGTTFFIRLPLTQLGPITGSGRSSRRPDTSDEAVVGSAATIM